jgi:hypothetical protein
VTVGRTRSPVAAILAVAVAVGAAACGTAIPTIDGVPATGPNAPSVTVRPTIVPIPGHEVYGFLPYWEMEDSIVEHVGATDLTTLGLFSVTHRRNGKLDEDQNGYRIIGGDLGRRLIRVAHDRGTRVELVYTSFGDGKNRQFYTEPEAQARWIEVLVDLVDQLGFDGVNVDVEALPAEFVLDYGAFVGRLRVALQARLPNAQVSVATQANELGAAMASRRGGQRRRSDLPHGLRLSLGGLEPGGVGPDRSTRRGGTRPRLVVEPLRGPGRARPAHAAGAAAVRGDVAGHRAGRRVAIDRPR